MPAFLRQLLTALAIVLGGGISFRVGGKVVTASLNGQPHHLSLNEALQAIALVESGATGTVQVGDVVLVIS